MPFEVRLVDSRTVKAGGVTAANFPHRARNALRDLAA